MDNAGNYVATGLSLRQVKTGDGRVLAVEVSGAPHGFPVFLLHGTPGSRSGPRPRGSVLYRLGIRLICYDRPGYGGSTRSPGRRVADAVADVAAIADELGLPRFSVAGRSGGGPHALACAAMLPARVVRAAVLVGLAPANAPGLDWFLGMAEGNVDDFSAADEDPYVLAERFRLLAEKTLNDPGSFLDRLRRQMTPWDRRVVQAPAMRRQLADAYVEALRDGAGGWIDDVAALRSDWGFALGDISSPVLLWHGDDDNFAPAGHTRWLAAQIPHAEVKVQINTAHFGAVEVLPEILSWLSASRLSRAA